MNILITGGAGFIGSNLVRYMVKKYPGYKIINLDKLTYAGNLENLKEVEKSSSHLFIKGDICDKDMVLGVFEKHSIDSVMHLAAESHVDRSILGPEDFLRTNIFGTYTLLEACRKYWGRGQGAGGMEQKKHIFLNVSTDEVYGSIPQGSFTVDSPYAPNSPYSASKAGADHLVRAYNKTFGLPAITTHSSNNYGPYQLPEKLIPLMILNALEGKPLPVYGEGKNVRDWLHVEDHVRALDMALQRGMETPLPVPYTVYNIGAGSEWKNIDLVKKICLMLDELRPDSPHRPHSKLIKFVKDRPGHDLRYSIDSAKITEELGWKPAMSLPDGLKETVRWYIGNTGWADSVRSGDYLEYYEKNYSGR